MLQSDLRIALLVFLAFGGVAQAAPDGCARYGEADWRAPAKTGNVVKAWPLTARDERAWGEEKARIVPGDGGAEVEVVYPRGSINPGNPRAPEGGLGFYDQFSAGDDLAGCLSYEVRFEPGFRFAKGGKLPGLWGGRNVSGCTKDRENGFSTRYMWNGAGRGYVYAYHAARRNRCGDNIGFAPHQKPFHFTPGRWHRLEQLVVLNAPGRSNGVLKVWFDGELVIDERRLRFRDKGSIRIDGLMFSTFFGGASRGNASPREQKTWFRNFEYRALPPSAPVRNAGRGGRGGRG